MKYEINEETALSVLIEILSENGIWDKNQDIRTCCKYIGANKIELETKIEAAVNILQGN